MNIRDIVRYFAWGLLLSPVVLVALWFVITYLPEVAGFLYDTVWGLLGEIPVFSQASALLQEWVNHSHYTVGNYFNNLLVLLFLALSDSLIIGCCVFFVKSVCTFFNRRWQGRFTRPEWLLVLIGVVVGVIACRIKGALPGLGASLLTLILCLACFIGGIALMLRGANFTRGGRYNNRWAGFVINLMLGILGNVFDALCGVFIVTALFSGRYVVQTGRGIFPCILWIVIACLLLFVKNALMDLMQPNDV